VRSSVLLEGLEVEIELFSKFLKFRTHTKFVREKQILALGVCFAQPCLSAGRRFAASRSHFESLLTNCFVSTTPNSMKCLLNWILLNIRICSSPQPHLKLSIIVNYGLSHRLFQYTLSSVFLLSPHKLVCRQWSNMYTYTYMHTSLTPQFFSVDYFR